MNNRALAQACSYLRFLARSRSRFSVHSPFIYDLTEKVLRAGSFEESGDDIERLRLEARKSDAVIRKRDFGSVAGQVEGSPREYPATVGSIARKSLLPVRRARQLHRLVKFTGARQVLELGTSLGLTTAWLARALPERGRVISLEGCPETAGIARNNLERLGLGEKVLLLTGTFAETLPEALKMMPSPELVFIDGHHLEEPTLDYFRQCLAHRTANTVIVIDDIHRSPGMESAWKTIKADPEVRVTIDLFRMGWIFFREGLCRQHFILRY